MKRDEFQVTGQGRSRVRESVRIMHRQCVGMCEGREILGAKAYAVVLYNGPRAVRVIAASSDLNYLSGVADGIYYTGERTLIGLESCAELPTLLGVSTRR
ncbi:hypothetical protein [Streptomyces atratus]|uniref:hypothetical protein n=1 Tax=Streptomyces atratus TaxID=1893 RepID=UPI0036547BD9